ncbi:MAG: protein translocase subunit SecD [Candidatus Sungbacteria bacterium]|uniref:Protein translocase subunit SecD n=1 Tax=Candidatus Sungiibacteriota bacterium TaxID=2750080 RepID=A0A932VRF1_9BACT|nr:protein translocase subunit SecD [Candidatus Sungbacteria bacterium]
MFDAPSQTSRLVGARKFLSYFPYRLGLDIQGGTHLVYRADLKDIPVQDAVSSLEALRDVIERRVNLFGVAEPLVQIEHSVGENRLIVELAGVRDVNAAIRLIGATPYLEFREERTAQERVAILDEQKKGQQTGEDADFKPTELTGRYIKRADVDFGRNSFQPQVSLELADQGAKIFADLTARNIGKRLAMYLDGAPISAPVVREAISGGRAQITGNFTPQQASELAGRLNAGALPVPIALVAQQSVEASLGAESLHRSLYAGLIGFLAVAVFMILWYRLPGLLAVLALSLYAAIVLAIFKLIPVTVTVAGIAGFILSIGMAVDANILIFERMKEELRQGRALEGAIREGFGRAWTSIRDSNISSLITSAILYWLGTSVVRGFALTLGIGILVSMFSAVSVSRTLLLAVLNRRSEKMKILFLNGFSLRV